MPDPIWSYQYNYPFSPELNGWTRIYTSDRGADPEVKEIHTGGASNRRVEINSTSGDAIFVSSAVPSIDDILGGTFEVNASCDNQVGDACWEIGSVNRTHGISLGSGQIAITVAGNDGSSFYTIKETPSNVNGAVIRSTVDTDGNLRVYYNGSGIYNAVMPIYSRDSQRILWCGETGGIQIFKGLKHYLGGPVAPG